MIKRSARKAFAMMEYVILLLIVMSGLIGFGFYIRNAYQGQVQRSGESFAFGRQYSPKSTIDCGYHDRLNAWYSEACYRHKVALDKCSERLDTREACAWEDAYLVKDDLTCARRQCLLQAVDGCRPGCRN